MRKPDIEHKAQLQFDKKLKDSSDIEDRFLESKLSIIQDNKYCEERDKPILIMEIDVIGTQIDIRMRDSEEGKGEKEADRDTINSLSENRKIQMEIACLQCQNLNLQGACQTRLEI